MIVSKSKLFFAITAVILFDLILLWFVYTSPVDKSANQEIRFSIAKGESNQEIANKLHLQGLIRVPILFRAYTYMKGTSSNLQAGDYLLRTSMNMPQVALQLTSGHFIDHQLRLLEGWNLKNIAQDLEDQGFFSQDEFFQTAGIPGIDLREDDSSHEPMDFSEEFSFLKEKPDYVSLEGYLFPDTYSITKGDTPDDIIRRILRNFETQITPDMMDEIYFQDKTLFEILTMASIIEKEVRSLKDKKIVSGILWKRLQEGVRLQVDATIVYVREGNYYKVTFDELDVESSYNTYTNYGLPPGPISNPGLESIDAALHPTESPYWFYLSPSLNTTIFSETFKQHKAAANLYLRY